MVNLNQTIVSICDFVNKGLNEDAQYGIDTDDLPEAIEFVVNIKNELDKIDAKLKCVDGTITNILRYISDGLIAVSGESQEMRSYLGEAIRCVGKLNMERMKRIKKKPHTTMEKIESKDMPAKDIVWEILSWTNNGHPRKTEVPSALHFDRETKTILIDKDLLMVAIQIISPYQENRDIKLMSRDEIKKWLTQRQKKALERRR